MSIISFKNFNFKYENLKSYTLKNINLDIESGEKILIAGPSGSGKSTLAHCINGLIPFTYKGSINGELVVEGFKPYEKSIYEVSNYVGTIMQDQDAQFVGLSVGEDVAFSYENNNVPIAEMHSGVENALNRVGMLPFINETPHSLSGGEKQKVSIAGILTTNAHIMLFDEPLANLDPASTNKALDIIDSIHNNGEKTVIVVEHRIEDVVAHNYDKIVLMEAGEIVAIGAPDDILASDLLPKYGLREPLYLEVLKKCGIKLTKEDKISKIENSIKYKDILLKEYSNLNTEKKSIKKAPILSLENISFKYYKDDPYNIKNVSFNINKGELLAVLGNNGAGKSTIMKIICGINKNKEGNLLLNGKNINKLSIKKRAEAIGYVMQNPNHMITKNLIFDEVAFGLKNSGFSDTEISEKVEETLKICGLHAYRNWPISALSYGQKKRVTIASILVMDPKVIILDEPTAGQDHRNYVAFMKFLELLKKRDISIVIITHDMHLALEYADRAVVISDGRVIADDLVYNILSNSDIMNRANLSETSISKLAEIYELKDKENFLAYFTTLLKAGEKYE
ncbi:energy-coupling factor transport system ATP-binding protein [Clostridium acidisoli DSM 12555]|uniref:Energy-coupling factor transport system ATP-binding protein n=1 Tax=Clostridium acidisoli DSM 12555 TaxID=1121291 RepID=A0A1W1XFU3_9CLOT|nr:ABC transporter ATP-binding protein [Clostridium acidisoli]SMC22843.1 energy-coupling factor transport system ATP-binding protein [Clostridium acidisoli DSM 12555]